MEWTPNTPDDEPATGLEEEDVTDWEEEGGAESREELESIGIQPDADAAQAGDPGDSDD